MSAQNGKLYSTVIEEVINGVRDLFLDEGVDEQVLQELKQTWERKLLESKAIDYSDKYSEIGSSSLSANNRLSNQGSNSSTRTSNSSRNTNATRDVNQQARRENHPTNQASADNHPQILQGTSVPPTTLISSNTSRHIVSTGTSGSESLNFSSGNIIPPSLIQFTSSEGVDGPKTVTIVPQKLALAFNPQTSGLSPVVGSSGTTSLALHPDIAASFLQQAAFNTGNVINITQPQDTIAHYTTNQTNAINNGSTIQIQPTASNQVNQRTVSGASRDSRVVQLDGDGSSDDDDDDEDDFRENDEHEDNDDDQNDDEHEYTGEEEEPLNSEDDVSDEDPHELFDTDNVVVCQYDKITRSRNKWKFHLKDGIMNLQGKDYVFQKAIGDAEW